MRRLRWAAKCKENNYTGADVHEMQTAVNACCNNFWRQKAIDDNLLAMEYTFRYVKMNICILNHHSFRDEITQDI